MQLAQGGETSAEYSIHLPRQLPPREFILQLTLVYAAAGQFKTKLFFNETIQVGRRGQAARARLQWRLQDRRCTGLQGAAAMCMPTTRSLAAAPYLQPSSCGQPVRAGD